MDVFLVFVQNPGLVSSMLPPFAIELVERACDYVTRIPKPRAVKSGRVSLELATMGLLHGALCIAGSQTDKDPLAAGRLVDCFWGGKNVAKQLCDKITQTASI